MRSQRILFRSLPLVTCVVASLAGAAFAHHAGDIALQVVNGQIVTGVWHDEAFEPLSVYESRFNDTGVDPNWTNEPGFDSELGTWTYPSTISFNILDAIQVWNGEDFSTLADQQIQIAYGANSVTTPAESTTLAGFGIGVSSDGSWHRHLEFELLDSVYTNGFAQDGIYLLKLELTSSDPAVSTSNPFYLVFQQEENTGDGGIGSETQHEAAVNFLTNQLASVPEPGTFALLATGMAAASLGLWRRRGNFRANR